MAPTGNTHIAHPSRVERGSSSLRAVRLGFILETAVLAVVLASNASAQTPGTDSDPFPITVVAKPAVSWVNRPLVLTGSSLSVGKLNTVTLIVQPPIAGKPRPVVTLKAVVDDNGIYEVAYKETSEPGTYTVSALAADGRGTAKTSFRIVNAAAVKADAKDVFEKATEAAVEIVQAARQKVDALPPSPAKDDIVRDLGEIDQKVKALHRDSTGAGEAVSEIIELDDKLPNQNDKLINDRDQLTASLQKGRDLVYRSQAELRALKQGQTTCDNLEVVVEGFKWISVLLNFAAAGPAAIAGNFGQDIAGYLAGKGASAAGADEDPQFAASEGAKNAGNIASAIKNSKKATAFEGVVSDSIGTINDVAGQMAEDTMRLYCEQFVGPMKAHMKAQFFNDEGVKWWEYEFDLVGRVTVHYPKDPIGSNIPVKGRVEGYGYNFKVWENALTVLYPSLMSGTFQKRIVIPPFELGKNPPNVAPNVIPDNKGPKLNEAIANFNAEYIEGSVFGAALPNSFFFEVTGTADKDKLTLNVGASRTDMDPKARVIAIGLPTLSLEPFVQFYELPYKNAHFVFERASGVYEIPLKTVGKVIRGEKHFESKGDGKTGRIRDEIRDTL